MDSTSKEKKRQPRTKANIFKDSPAFVAFASVVASVAAFVALASYYDVVVACVVLEVAP